MSNIAEDIIRYFETALPGYPFNQKLDTEFVDELLVDFGKVDILEETKSFRWYYNNEPVKNARIGLRRWLANALRRQNQGFKKRDK